MRKGWKYDYRGGFYRSWEGMKSRCNNKNHIDFPRWGGRGISYETRWEKFEEFKKDMESSYVKGLTLDRIDNSKNYSKDNCRWATRKDQNNNRRDNINISYKGQTKTLSQWTEDLGFKGNTLRHRLLVYKWDLDKAFTTPARGWIRYEV